MGRKLPVWLGNLVRPGAWRAVVFGVRLVWRAWPAGAVGVAVLSIATGVLPSGTVLVVWRIVAAATSVVRRPGQAAMLGVFLAALGGAQFLLLAVLEGLSGRLAYRVGATAQADLIRLATRAPYRRFYDQQWRDRLGRVSDDVEWRPTQVTQALLRLVSNLVGLAGSAGLLAVLNGWLIMFAVLAAVPLVIVERRNSRTLHTVWRATSGLNRQMDYVRGLATSPERAAELRAFGLSGYLVAWHGDAAGAMLTQVRRGHRANLRRAVVAGVSSTAALSVAYLVLLREATAATPAPATLFLVLCAFGAVNANVMGLFSHLVDVESNGAYLADLRAAVEEPVEDVAVGGPAPPCSGIEVRGLSFGYQPDRPVLDQLSFTVAPGTFVAVVGANGAGKSTLVKLLLRLLEPDHGQIVVGGRDVADIAVAAWRSRVAVLFQDYGRYETTVAESVRLGRVDTPADQARLLAALADAGGDRVVSHLPSALDTQVGRLFDGAHGLSGGQWQRLALARVLYRDADLYILDEPTAALDPDMEQLVFATLRERLAGRTVLFITHRMAAAAQADHIVVLHERRTVEEGSHAELMRLNGRYAEMYRTQASAFLSLGEVAV